MNNPPTPHKSTATGLRSKLSMTQKMPKRGSRTCWPYMLPWWTRETDFSTATPATDKHHMSGNPAANANHAEASTQHGPNKRDDSDNWPE